MSTVETDDPTISTREALRLIGLGETVWRNAVQTGYYPSPPEVVGRGRGRGREWTLDDLIAARWFAANLAAGMKAPFCGKCSNLLLEMMREYPDAPEFYVYVTINDDGERADLSFQTEHSDDPKSEQIFTAPVSRWRSDTQRILDEHLAKRAKRNGAH